MAATATSIQAYFIYALLFLAGASDLVEGQKYTGDATAYGNAWQGGACLYQSVPKQAELSFVAINQVLWDKLGVNQVCGRCVKMSYGSKTVIGMVTNRCPECAESALDLSDDIFFRLTGSYPSRLTISWELVDCDESVGVTGDVGFYTKDGVNGNWLAVQPLNFKRPITKISVEYPAGRMTEMVFGTGGLNYYIAAGLMISGQYKLHATDVSGVVHTGVAGGVQASSYISASSSSSVQSSLNVESIPSVSFSSSTSGGSAGSGDASLFDNVNFLGADLYSKSGISSASGCAAVCTGDCDSFTWAPWFDGTCYLKASSKGYASVGTANGLVSGVLKGKLITGIDFYGRDIGSTSSTSASDCLAACKAKDSCSALTWTNFNGGSCWMKSSPGSDLRAHSNALSAVP